MNVLLVRPPFYSILGYPLSKYPPTGLCYLAAVLENNDIKTRVLDTETIEFHHGLLQKLSPIGLYKLRVNKDLDLAYKEIIGNKEHEVWKKIQHEIEQRSPDLLGITALTATINAALMISKIVKDQDQDLPIVLGGPHPSILPEKALQNDSVDFVVRGEGEMTLLELVRALEGKTSLDQVHGLSFKRNNRIHHNPDRAFINDLDKLPFPAKHLVIGKEKLSPIHFGRLFTSRGCPYNCIFCNSGSIWGRKVRYRSPQNILNEILVIMQRYGTKYFHFDDDTLTINRKRILTLCDLLIENQLDIKWWCETRVNLIDDELLKKMKAAGCSRISIGIESGDPKILEKIKKGITVEQAKRASKLLHKHDMNFHAFFMIGFPWETETEIQNTVRLMKEINPDYAHLSVVTPYPNTELFSILSQEGVNVSDDWSDSYHSRPKEYYNLRLDQQEFSNLVSDATKIFNRHNRMKVFLGGGLFKDARIRILLWESIKRHLNFAKRTHEQKENYLTDEP